MDPASPDTALPLAALIPDPRNARRHGARNRRLIVDALKDVGAARSIGVDERGVVLAGNATIAVRRTWRSGTPPRCPAPKC